MDSHTVYTVVYKDFSVNVNVVIVLTLTDRETRFYSLDSNQRE